MEAVFLQVLWVSLTVSAVLLPLLLAKGWLRRRVRAKALYVIWLLLALRLVIPADLSMPEPLVTVEAPSYQLVLPVRTPSANPSAEVPMAEADQNVPETSPFALSFPVNALLSALWLFGVLAAALVQGGGYLLVRRRLLRGARPVEEELEAKVRRTAGRLCLTRVFSVCQSGGIRTPMVLGLLRPVLLLPEGQPVDEVVLCHELTHLKRHDLLYKALLTAACWLHWFNPLVWWMSRAASENLELCCDGDVTAGQDAAFRQRYGELLLSAGEEGRGPTLSSRFGGSGRTVKERLTNLFLTKRRGRALACLAVAAVALLGALTSCQPKTQTGQEAMDALNESLDWSLGNEGTTLSFTIPEGERDWDIRLSQDAFPEDPDVIQSFNETQWTPGERYSFLLPRDILLGYQLTLNVSLNGGAEGFTVGMTSMAMTPNASQTALEQLRSSITYDGERVSFTIPEGDRAWNIQISGRAEVEWLGGMSLHYLDGTDWTAGETYSFELSSLAAQDVTQLTMYVFLEKQESEIDLLPYLPYVNAEYGFTLTLPQSWRGQVELLENDPNLHDVTCAASFYMRDAGDQDYAGWLVGIYRCTSQEWEETEAAGNPYDLPVLAEAGGYVFYAAGPTDLPVDESIPGALERYTQLSAQISALLESFTLTA